MKFYEMDTFVAPRRTVEGALDLARFMESRFPLDPKSVLPEREQLHKFLVVVGPDGKIEVRSVVPVNDLGREEFRKHVVEFTTLTMRKPIQVVDPRPNTASRAA